MKNAYLLNGICKSYSIQAVDCFLVSETILKSVWIFLLVIGYFLEMINFDQFN